mmetsp:Transcript_22237/g.26405  ORF Transcript_22237/g.26405 Transcript_22237/m.26405 type:complete len:228 (-) Transcript_22237:279-962(-)
MATSSSFPTKHLNSILSCRLLHFLSTSSYSTVGKGIVFLPSSPLLLPSSSHKSSKAWVKSCIQKSLDFNMRYTSPTVKHFNVEALSQVTSLGDDQLSFGRIDPPKRSIAFWICSFRIGKWYSFSSSSDEEMEFSPCSCSLLTRFFSSSSLSSEDHTSSLSLLSGKKELSLVAPRGSVIPSPFKYSKNSIGRGLITIDRIVTFLCSYCWIFESLSPSGSLFSSSSSSS